MVEQKNNIKGKTKLSLIVICLSLVLVFIGLFMWAINQDIQSSKYLYILKTHILNQDTSPPANYTGTWIYWGGDGNKNLEQDYLNGIEHGKTIIYDNKGNKQGEISRSHGKMHGATKQWYPNQQLKSQVFYRDGKLHGRSQYWNKKGELIADGEYVDGMPFEGTFAKANPLNKIDRILEYKDGELIKERKYNP